MQIISISGVIGWDVTPDDVRNQLKKAKGDITVEIGSPGGFVFDGLEIFNLIRDYSKGKSTTKLMGIAASMASYIALAGDKITAHDNAIYMIHNALSVAVGNHNDMREQADFLEKISNHLAKEYVNKTGKSLKEIKDIMDNEGWFFGSEAKEAGFVDEIIETENTKDKESAKINALTEIEKCNKIMSDYEENDDRKKAVALIKPIIINDLSSNVSGINNNKPKIKEIKTMETKNLNDFLANNSDAKAEYDEAIAEATKQGQETINARIESAKNFLANKNYPTLATMALDVITGKIDSVALTASVSAIDALNQNANSDEAKAETDKLPETKGEKKDGEPTAEESYQAKKERMKG